MNFSRSGGILLHVSSLPGNQGIGSLSKDAYRWIDFLADSGTKLWQICPLGPIGYGNSPYQTYSAFAGNPYFIDIEALYELGLLSQKQSFDTDFAAHKVDYDKVITMKNKLLRSAFQNFTKDEDYLSFEENESYWLTDYALFMSLKEHFDGKSWSEWPDDIRLRESAAIEKYKKLLSQIIDYHKFLQYLFLKQWQDLHSYAGEKGIQIIGDIPIFVSYDSVEAWSKPEMFLFDTDRKPIVIAGVPPDYFSDTGQLWGNPLYDWEYMRSENFAWWIKRFEHMMKLTDITRIDHFRGFAAYWAIPYGDETAENGKWQPVPGEEFFESLEEKLGKLPIIAEDLGYITEDVHQLRNKFDLPGMKVLQFAFTDMDNAYLPHHYPENCVVYTGTHDNDTLCSWYKSLSEKEKSFVHEYIDYNEDEDICWQLIRLAWQSRADIAIAPIQDFLCLDNWGRMNKPGTVEDNWQWRLEEKYLSDELSKRIEDLNKSSGRI
jgi:4-alpha-glucanotransferase